MGVSNLIDIVYHRIMKRINCDLGECLIPDPDSDIMPLIDMANIACGGHVGDDNSMIKTLILAKQHGVSVGAHPAYVDKSNFGRVSHDLTSKQLFDVLSQQLTQFINLCQQYDVTMDYIKPHGALYHDMMYRDDVLDVLCEVIKIHDPNLSLVVQAGIEQQRFIDKSTQVAITFIYEAFADRKYQGNKLVARTEQGAVLQEPEHIIKQYHDLSQSIEMQVDTICFHSDNPASVRALQLLKKTAK